MQVSTYTRAIKQVFLLPNGLYLQREQNLFCWFSDTQNTRLSYAYISYYWIYWAAVVFISSIIFILTTQLDHRRGVQESCSLPLIQLLLLTCNIKGVGMTCSRQRQCWEQSEVCISAPASLSCPVECSKTVYSSVSLLLLPQLVKLGHSFAGQNSGYGHEEHLQYQRHGAGRGKQAQKHCHSQKKAMENWSVTYTWPKTFLDKFKNPIKTTKSLPCYTHTFTEQEQCISSQITLWRGIPIPWHHSLNWDLRPHPLLLSTWLLTLSKNWSRHAFVTQSLFFTILICALHLCFADMHPTVPDLCLARALISL